MKGKMRNMEQEEEEEDLFRWSLARAVGTGGA